MSRGAVVAGTNAESLSILASVRGRFLDVGFLHTEDFAGLHHFKQIEELSITIHIWNFLYVASTPGSCPLGHSLGVPTSNKDRC